MHEGRLTFFLSFFFFFLTRCCGCSLPFQQHSDTFQGTETNWDTMAFGFSLSQPIRSVLQSSALISPDHTHKNADLTQGDETHKTMVNGLCLRCAVLEALFTLLLLLLLLLPPFFSLFFFFFTSSVSSTCRFSASARISHTCSPG